MVARDRFGGLYSTLSRRDLADIDAIEYDVVENPIGEADEGEIMAMVWLEDDPPVHFSGASPDYTLQEIADHLESVKDYFKDSLENWFLGEDGLLTQATTKDDRVYWGQMSGRFRKHMGTVDRILRKVKRAIRKLDTEALD